MRKFVDEYIYPDAQVRVLPALGAPSINPVISQARELDGKRPSQSVIDKMA